MLVYVYAFVTVIAIPGTLASISRLLYSKLLHVASIIELAIPVERF